MAMLESLAMGVPAIVPDIGGLSEAVSHGTTGLVFTPGSVDELAASMRRMMENRPASLEMGENGARMIAHSFTRDKMLDRSEQVLLSACKGHSCEEFRV